MIGVNIKMKNIKVRILNLLIYLLVISLFLFYVSDLECKDEVSNDIYYLRFSSIGFPIEDKEKEARKINDIKLFMDRLYIGSGDAVVNTGPTDVIYYDLKRERFVNEFRVDDEAIYLYQEVDGKLVIPGPDATQDWKMGNVYVLTKVGWIKRRTIPNGIHVNSLASFHNRWYTATGNYFEFYEDQVFPFGGVFSSEDEGETWKLVYSSPSDESKVFRIGSIITYGDRLYAFPYAFRGMKKNQIPEKYRNFLSDKYNDNYLIFSEDPLGPSDVIIFDGEDWKYEDFIKTENVCYMSPFVFEDKLFISVLTGKYVDYLSLKNGLPENASSFLMLYDGKSVRKLPFEYSIIRDVTVKENKLVMLILKNNHYMLAETEDIENWCYYMLPYYLKSPASVEFDGLSYYIGVEDGNVFKSVGKEILKDSSLLAKSKPTRFFGAAKLPREGKWYWGAITGWERWGKLAKFSCHLLKGNVIDVETENVNSFSLFVPLFEISTGKPLLLRINKGTFFNDKLNGNSVLVCRKTGLMSWEVQKDSGSIRTFKYNKKIMGYCALEFSQKNNFQQTSAFIGDVIRWASNVDAAVVPQTAARRVLKNGEVFLEDIFDMNYPDTVYTFRIKGVDLYEMMDYNIKIDKSKRCSISGFSISFRSGKKERENNIIESSLDPAREYTVATTGYLVQRMKEYLGDEVNCKNNSILVTDAMMRWFEKFGEVTSMENRIKRIER
jgi:hypothetical protein